MGIVVDSVAYAHRQAPRNFPDGGAHLPRKRKALPSLGSTQPSSSQGGNAPVSAEQMATITKNRLEAVRRKGAKQRHMQAALPEMPSDDENPLGLDCSFD